MGYPGGMSTLRENPAEAAGGREVDDLAFDVLQRRCPSRPALEHITGRWGTLVLLALREGPTRFNELRRRVDGVSEKMLAQSLHALERDGFVGRTVHSTIPPRVEYTLTPLGMTVMERLTDLVECLEGAMPEILAAQERYDAAVES